MLDSNIFMRNVCMFILVCPFISDFELLLLDNHTEFYNLTL